MMKRWGLLVLLLLLGCRGEERPLPTLTPSPTNTPIPATLTPTATTTPTPLPTATHTATPVPSPTPVPTATPTPTPSEGDTAVPNVTQQSTVQRWQGVAEYSFFSQSRQQEIFFTLYTPPGYDQSTERYPVLYFLHGSQGSHILFWNAISREVAAANGDAGAWLSQLISRGELPPFIVAAPRRPDGAWDDANAELVTQELIAAVDGHWRTIADRNGRSLAGFSLGAAGTMRYAAQRPDLYCNAMPLAESGVDDAATWFEQNGTAVLQSGLEVALVVGELDTRGVNASTAVADRLTQLGIPHQLQIVPDVPHNFGQLYNQIGLQALQFHASCWQN
ncbi:MAG: hypothetical protein H6654_19000 [Ardenticatenaceae bacterium]|nr:hypothetical protein [Anaerolineales bacterium]MCB8938290.1 hypothetical protein [Ardenticatenaceae bacterium]MCB8975655.1 hypothetical protein [Ardenticatenaceae bacterium]